MGIDVVPLGGEDRAWVTAFLEAEAGSPLQAAHGELMQTDSYPGFIASIDGRRVALATFVIRDDECEMTTLHASERYAGAGTALVGAVETAARQAGCRSLWLITTNDNVDAMRFYQRRGFRLAAVYPGAVDEARRRLKPEIPMVGEYGIPLRDEVRFEKPLG